MKKNRVLVFATKRERERKEKREREEMAKDSARTYE